MENGALKGINDFAGSDLTPSQVTCQSPFSQPTPSHLPMPPAEPYFAMSMAGPQPHPPPTLTSRGAGTHRNDLPTHAHRLMAGIAEEVAIDRNGFPMVLISPASVIAKKRKKSKH